jgi:hypothetical protein
MSRRCEATSQRATDLASADDANFHAGCVVGMAGRYTGRYLDRSNGGRAVAILADIGRASLVGRTPKKSIRMLPGEGQ